MSDCSHEAESRRRFLQLSAAGAAGLALPGAAAASARAAAPCAAENTVRDKLWIFTVYAGGDNKGWGLPKPSRMTAAEGAMYLNVPNLLFIRSHEQPPIDEFRQWAIPFRPLKRVLWSLVGSGGKTGDAEREAALELARHCPNIVGFIMDDFFHRDGKGSLTPEQLEQLRGRLVIEGRRRELYVVVYTHMLDLPMEQHLRFCDKITLWTWKSNDLENLQSNFERVEKLAPKHGKLLGCYMWDYGNKKPMPVERMEHQCKLALEWLRQKRLEGIIFLANTTCDLDLEAVEFTRNWIRQVGDEKL